MVRRTLAGALLSVGIAAAAPAGAATFRYAYRVDPANLDPYALAETFTLSRRSRRGGTRSRRPCGASRSAPA